MATAAKDKTEMTPGEEALADIAQGLLSPEDVGHLIDTGFITLDEAMAVVTKGVKRNAEKAKEWEDRKGFDRGVFFELATRYAEETLPLERKSITIPTTMDVKAEVAKRYPLYRIVEMSGSDVLIEEDPAKLKVSVQFHGFEFTRGVTMRGSGFDVKRFMADHEGQDVVNAIIDQNISMSQSMSLKGVQTRAILATPLADLIEEGLATVTYSLNDKKAETYLDENPEWLETFQQYVIEGTPSSSLLAPKKLSKKAKK